jgi:hypothetical protein
MTNTSQMDQKVFIASFFLTMISVTLHAQTKDFGLRVTGRVEKKIDKWLFGTEAEFRTKGHSGQTDRWSMLLETNYNIHKLLRAGLAYKFIYFHDTDYADYQPRHRFCFYIQGKQNLGNFKFSLRERLQLTLKDESDRKKNGRLDTYRIDPDVTWRNRIKISYNVSGFPVDPAFSFESRYQLNDPDKNSFEKLRYVLSLNYKPDNHHEFEIYGLIDRNILTDEAARMYVAGIEYVYSF